ncbi:MAG: hypothetical protein ABIA67_00900 [Candidatus Margulisiibacteriota bacterium]
MRNKKEFIFWLLGVGVFLFFLVLSVKMPAYSDSQDTASGTTISAEASNCTLDYKDTGGSSMTQVNPASDILVTVEAIYGLSGMGTPADQTSVGPSDPKLYTYHLTNEGNATTTFSLTDEVTYGGGAAAWTVVISNEAGGTISTLQLAEDATADFYISVTPSTDASDGHRCTVEVFASTALTPVGAYTGANGLTYGGVAGANDTTVTSISGAPTLTLTRTSTVDAPTAHASHTGATIHDAVPGSVITFTYTYNNTGGGAATSNIIVDKIPTNTSACHVNATVEVVNVTITAPVSTATGWTVSTTESSTPSRVDQNTTGWTVIGTISAATDYATFEGGSGAFTLGIDKNSTFLKFEKASVAAAETATLMWGVTID